MRAVLLLSMLLSLAACGDDSDAGADASAEAQSQAGSGGGSGSDGGAPPQSSCDGTGACLLWECICRGMGPAQVDGGEPWETMESIEHCASSDPTDMLSERYRKAAEAAGPGITGSCDDCQKTETDCMPDAG